jgi:hypothetical protein
VARRQGVASSRLVQQTDHHAPACVSTCVRLARMIGGPAWDVGQDVPAVVINAQETRHIGVAIGFQVGKNQLSERAAGVPGTSDGVTDPDDFAGVVSAAADNYLS